MRIKRPTTIRTMHFMRCNNLFICARSSSSSFQRSNLLSEAGQKKESLSGLLLTVVSLSGRICRILYFASPLPGGWLAGEEKGFAPHVRVTRRYKLVRVITFFEGRFVAWAEPFVRPSGVTIVKGLKETFCSIIGRNCYALGLMCFLNCYILFRRLVLIARFSYLFIYSKDFDHQREN